MPFSLRLVPNWRSRAVQLHLLLVLATTSGMVMCLPLWTNTRAYPLVPIGSWLPTLAAPWDSVLLGAALATLLLGLWFPRTGAASFLALSLCLYLQDQTRGQPWFYMYWVLLALTLFPETTTLAAARVVVSGVYLWGGLQKCHASYFAKVPAWFVSPATNWELSPAWIQLLQWSVAAAPAIELFIAIGIWLLPCRKAALITALLLHAGALLFLGPLGHRYNLVVWPWNIAMVALLVVLFFGVPTTTFQGTLEALRHSKAAVSFSALVILLPALSFFGKWDSYFSFSLYSANLATSDLFMTPALRDRLPERVQQFVHPVSGAFDPTLQGPLVLDQNGWANEELGTPGLPEPRAFQALFRYLAVHVRDANELKMIVSPRSGPVTFHRVDGVWPLTQSSTKLN